ncbi:hypothetical protein GCM10023189_21900 [Nibrella saemangeumensis]|uniref:Gliding motility-associated C-terminal domain-containing protein n=1 Tax=Nibrella saemangeumensis TaxID=1084526 RepID=A0ABP8MUZ4_9BACT
MKFTYTAWLVTVLLIGSLWPAVSYATHVRAGEITTRRLPGNSLTYEVTLTVYFDIARGADAARQQETVTFCFGDGTTQEVRRLAPIPLRGNPNTTINIYRTTHTYPGPGTFGISVAITNRNNGTINMMDPVNTSFYISTTISVNAALGLNSTPVLLNPPLDSARVGQRFCHNPAAFDADGDSLAYRLTIPQQGVPSNPCRGVVVNGYRDPALGINPSAQNETQNAPATFTINPITGDLCWDAPGAAGQYNVAFIIEEWRNGVLIGEIIRDMQIIVTDSPNRRPQLQAPADLCVEAGTVINQTVTATDPDGHRLELSAFGGPFNRGPDGQPYPDALVAPQAATFSTPNQPQNSPATGTFRWQTNCNHIRQEPYDIIFRAIDFPGRNATQLATLQSFRITIIGPRPQNLTARATAGTTGERAVLLNWNAYTCAPAGSQMIIYRKEGCTPLTLDPCQTGLPAGSGYTEVGRVPITATSFTDTRELKRGIQYSYVIVAQYPLPQGGVSIASQPVCFDLPLLAPVLTNVTVDSTSETRGVITVRWTRPLGLNPGDLGSPYQYRLLRSTGSGTTSFTQVATISTNLTPGVADTVFVDRGLNTTQNAYTYQLEFYFTSSNGQLTRLDATEPASSVRLSTTPAFRQIQLSWQAQTPWSNENQRHRLYRSRTGPNGPFNLVAEVAVQGPATFTYTDTGTDTFLADGNTSLPLSADSSYCYRVETVGRYTDTRIPVGLLYNFSQIICASPIDTTRPCPPQLSLQPLDCAALTDESFCNQTTFSNNLSWIYPERNAGNQLCDQTVTSYNIYYSRYEQDEQSEKLTSVPAPTTTFEHNNLTSVAGCYYVTAVNRRGLESAPSNRVCNDNCPAYRLPNVFTPNGDGRNDVFQPMACPRFVETVEFVVYNRWGAKVFQTSDPTLNWNGRSSGGQELASGLYYYQVTVRFASVNRTAPPVVQKGWIQLLRDGVSMR